MTAQQLRRLLTAPELIVVDLVDHALRALRLALFVEHPLLDDDSGAVEDPPVQRRARLLLLRAENLRRAMHGYRREVERVLREDHPNDFPF